MAKIPTKRSEMPEGARKLLNEFDAFLNDIFEVRTDSLPEGFRGRGEFTSFESLNKKLAKAKKASHISEDAPVQFNTTDGVRSMTSGNSKRIARINRYQAQIAAGAETINYAAPKGDKQYNAMVAFACQLAKWGVLNEDSFDEEEIWCDE